MAPSLWPRERNPTIGWGQIGKGTRTRLTDCKLLSFDCDGTLIDGETGLLASLAPPMAHAGIEAEKTLAGFACAESAREAPSPTMHYAEILAHVHASLTREWNTASGGGPCDLRGLHRRLAGLPRFGRRPGDVGIKTQARHPFQRGSRQLRWRQSPPRLHLRCRPCGRGYRSYKPDLRDFRFLLARGAKIGIARKDIPHLAQSLYHGHALANDAGIASCWIDQRDPLRDNPRYGWQFESLTGLVTAKQAGRDEAPAA